MDCSPPGSSPWGFSKQECCSGLPFPSLEDLPDKGSNSGLLHCKWILYHLATWETHWKTLPCCYPGSPHSVPKPDASFILLNEGEKAEPFLTCLHYHHMLLCSDLHQLPGGHPGLCRAFGCGPSPSAVPSLLPFLSPPLLKSLPSGWTLFVLLLLANTYSDECQLPPPAPSSELCHLLRHAKTDVIFLLPFLFYPHTGSSRKTGTVPSFFFFFFKSPEPIRVSKIEMELIQIHKPPKQSSSGFPAKSQSR